MKPNELRIGNYVRVLGNDKVIRGISQYNQIQKTQTARHYIEFDNSIPINQIHLIPIPLTEDWLLKFGFIYESPDEGFIELTDRIYLYINTFDDKVYSYLSTDFDSEIPIFLTHVHQLQNLYFNLTHKELTIKELAQ